MGGFAKLKPHIQVLVVAGVCAVLLGAVWYWFLSPIQTDIEAQGAKLAQVEATVAKSLQRKAALDQFKKDAAALELQLNELKLILPQDREADQLFDQVEASARAAGLRIQRAVSRQFTDHDVYLAWPMEMEVVGTYHNVGTFLGSLRQLPRILNISKLRLESRASEGENAYTASVGATYEATTFVYREEEPEAPAAGQAAKAR